MDVSIHLLQLLPETADAPPSAQAAAVAEGATAAAALAAPAPAAAGGGEGHADVLVVGAAAAEGGGWDQFGSTNRPPSRCGCLGGAPVTARCTGTGERHSGETPGAAPTSHKPCYLTPLWLEYQQTDPTTF